MFLKSLRLRGFKSFADATQLDFRPGITVIVGPNGSGKSNIVDALTWSMGTRSAKDLRGGQMADVIFAGAGGRKAMGRSAVQITIDNADGSLPIEFSEVTVGRAMFANGENTYSINATECRQLDVAELLSDTGLGRQTHTIVGQGRIDAVLNARPEERRAFIEEAAGILKHRRRKERALRKLTQMEGHLERLVDVLGEMRRQLRPLERQAEAAQKHRDLSADLATVRRDRALREFADLFKRWNSELVDRADSDRRVVELDGAVGTHRQLERHIGDRLQQLTPAVRAATETHFALANVVERASGLVERIIERRNGLAEAAEEPIAGRPPAELRDEASQATADLEAMLQQVRATTGALTDATEATRSAEQARRAHQQAAAAEARRQVEARESHIRWEGEIDRLRGSLAQASAEQGRVSSQLQAQVDREAELSGDADTLNLEIQRLDASSSELLAHLGHLKERLSAAQQVADDALSSERRLERERASLEARADALFAASADTGEGARAVVAAQESGRLEGISGPLAAMISVVDGYAAAVSAALGPLADALVVHSPKAAESALGFVADADAGRVILLVADTRDPVANTSLEGLDIPGVRPLSEVVDGPHGVGTALAIALGGTYVCDDLSTAVSLAQRHPQLVFVTAAGEMAGARGHAGGAAAGRTAVLARAAAEAAHAQALEVAHGLTEARRAVTHADQEVMGLRSELEAAQAAVHESDAMITAAAQRMGRLGKELDRCRSEKHRVQQHHDQLVVQTAETKQRLRVLEDRGPQPAPALTPAAEGVEAVGEAGDLVAERLEDRLAEAREVEVQARLTASTAEQRAAELRRKIAELLSEADRVQQQLAQRQQRHTARLAAIAVCDRLEAVARRVLVTAQTSRSAAAKDRDQSEEARADQQRRLGVVRAKLAELEEQRTLLRDNRHRDELVRQELKLQLDGLRTRLAELDVDDGEAVLAERGDELLAGGEQRDLELAEIESTLAKKIGLLGTVNPLALDELDALRERHAFMSTQLDDLRSSKRDLLQVVAAVDNRIEAVFAAAFADVAAHFERIFPMLFPGGTGKLLLTDPDDLLASGVEVEARPPGKKVKRLSLLSGGERSLTALAVLFAIFAARPSPFYVLDEVEAALDDANLRRFLDVLRYFRGDSQWIIVSHQRRTMEVADTIYGVSMGSDGVSKVVSRELNDSGLVRKAS